MLLRILTAAVLIPVVVALVWFGPPLLLAAVAAVVSLLAMNEFFDLGERVGLKPFRKWTMVCAAGLFYSQYATGLNLFVAGNDDLRVPSIEAVLLAYLFGCVVIALATKRLLHEILPAISAGAGALLFVALPFSYLIRINELPFLGRSMVLFTLCLIWAGDMLAYFVGRWLGRRPMAPMISPKKTWEGAAGNILASLLIGLIWGHWIPMATANILIIAAVANIAGQAGDLLESAFKRGASVKDSSSLLPGHGGMFDRIDSLILAAPAVWIALELLVAK